MARRTRALRPGRRPGASTTRAALLAAGVELFAAHGYDAVPVWAIARKARVNKAMISYHFGGKRQLYREIVSATFAEIVRRIEGIATSPAPAPELLREIVATVGEIATHQHPHFCTMFLREVLGGGRQLDKPLLDLPVRVLAAVQHVVERGVREGALRPVDPLLTHMSMIGSLVFFYATARFRDRVIAARSPGATAPDVDAYVAHLQDLITHGLAAPAAARVGRSA